MMNNKDISVVTFVNTLPGGGVSIVDKTVIKRILPSGREWYQSFEHVTSYECNNVDTKLFNRIQRIINNNPYYKSGIDD